MLIPPVIMKLTDLADTESSRYILGGIRFDRQNGKPRACATDGRTLAVVTWNEDSPGDFPTVKGCNPARRKDFSAVIPVKACKEAAKLPPRKTHKPILKNIALDESSDGIEPVTLAGTDLETGRSVEVRPIKGKYPKVSQIIPEYQPHECLQYSCNPAYLSKLALLADSIATDYDNPAVILHVPLDTTRIMKVTANGTADFTGILMPRIAKVSDPVRDKRKAEEKRDRELLAELLEHSQDRQTPAAVLPDLLTPDQVRRVIAACIPDPGRLLPHDPANPTPARRPFPVPPPRWLVDRWRAR